MQLGFTAYVRYIVPGLKISDLPPSQFFKHLDHPPIMAPDKKIPNALKRSEQYRKSKREKGQAKLKRRLEVSVA